MPEPVERVLAKRGLDPFAEIGGDGRPSPVLNARCRAPLQLALRVGLVELGAGDADPGAAARRPGADVGRDDAVRTEREPDQLVAGALAAGVRMHVRSGLC